MHHDVYCTRNYRAPEIYTEVLKRENVTTAVDIWGLGCIVFEARTNKMLVSGVCGKQVRQSLKDLLERKPFNAPTMLKRRIELAAAEAKFLRRCLEPNPEQRHM